MSDILKASQKIKEAGLTSDQLVKLKQKSRSVGAPEGNQNAAKRGNDTTLIIACTKREKSGWVKAAKPGKLSDWVRERLNKKSGA